MNPIVRRNRWLIALILSLSLICSSHLAQAAEVLRGRVVGVTDGDTLTLLTPEGVQVKVRLAEIDAPEKAQPFGQRSKESLSELVFGKKVELQVQSTDRYGRTVGYVMVDAMNVNLEQVKRGMAWAYRQYLRDQEMLMAEEIAKEAKRGLWSQPKPIPPWEYRRSGFGS